MDEYIDKCLGRCEGFKVIGLDISKETDCFIKEYVEKNISERIICSDILNCSETIIVHRVDDSNMWCTNLAKRIKNIYPHIYESCINDKASLGEIILSPIKFNDESNTKYIANIYSNIYRDGKTFIDYKKLKLCFMRLNEYIKILNNDYGENISLAIPYENNNWLNISRIIVEELGYTKYKIYKG